MSGTPPLPVTTRQPQATETPSPPVTSRQPQATETPPLPVTSRQPQAAEKSLRALTGTGDAPCHCIVTPATCISSHRLLAALRATRSDKYQAAPPVTSRQPQAAEKSLQTLTGTGDAPWPWVTAFILLLILQFLHLPAQSTLHLHAPTLPDTAQVFVAGNQEALGNWNPARAAMQPLGNHNWTLTFPATDEVEYKYTLGTWGTEGLGPDAKVGPNLRLNPTTSAVKHDTILHWLNGSRPEPQGQVTGTVRYHLNVQPQGLAARNVVVWLPPGYEQHPGKRYPVLYMHDGQNVFDPKTSSFGVDWEADETCDRLIQQGNIQPLIVVAVYCNGPERREEYSPGAKGTAYMDFLIHQLKPMIDHAYRTKAQARATYVGGSSMGGLISFMLVWEHPEVFSKAICMSPAFQFKDFDYLPTVRNATNPPEKATWYIDNGGVGLEQVLQPGIDSMLLALTQRGYRAGKDFFWYRDPEAEHNEAAWAKRLPIALKLLIGRRKSK